MNTRNDPPSTTETKPVEAVPEACCSVSEQVTCCEPSAKAGCCGTQAAAPNGKASNSCGCR